MAVPGYQVFMYPFLEELSDGQEHSLRELYDKLAQRFNLTEDVINELLPSGKQTILHNRISWARTYLTKAGLMKTVRRAV